MVTNVEAEARCRDFVTRALRALDDRDYGRFAEAFAADGVWERGGERLVGPEGVRAAMAKRPADLETQHLALNMIVDLIAEDEAIVRYTVAPYAQMTGKPYHLHGMFRATDRLTRTAEGWRFAHRAVAPAFPPQD